MTRTCARQYMHVHAGFAILYLATSCQFSFSTAGRWLCLAGRLAKGLARRNAWYQSLASEMFRKTSQVPHD